MLALLRRPRKGIRTGSAPVRSCRLVLLALHRRGRPSEDRGGALLRGAEQRRAQAVSQGDLDKSELLRSEARYGGVHWHEPCANVQM